MDGEGRGRGCFKAPSWSAPGGARRALSEPRGAGSSGPSRAPRSIRGASRAGAPPPTVGKERTPTGRGAGPARGAECPVLPRRWHCTCGDGACAPRVPPPCPASLGEHGASRAGADPAELAGGEPKPTGARRSAVHQVRVARSPGGPGSPGSGDAGAWSGMGSRWLAQLQRREKLTVQIDVRRGGGSGDPL